MGADGEEVSGADLGKIIEQARYRQGSTQREVAEKLGVHWVTISKLERGTIPVTREWAERLASVLPIDFDDLDPQKGRKSGYLLSGTLNDWGSVSLTQGDRLRTSGDNLRAQGRWFEVHSHLFQPILNKGDIVRLSDIGGLDPVRYAQGKFCLAEDEKSGNFFFGVYTGGPTNIKEMFSEWRPRIVCPFYTGVSQSFPNEKVPPPLEMPFRVISVVSQVIVPALRPDLRGVGETMFWE